MKRRLALVLALVLVGCGPAQKSGPVTAEPVKITQFYTTTPKVPAGEQATICYGVEGAASVRIEPAVEELVPSLARCISFAPRGTEYKLVARGKGGEEVSQTLQLGAAAAVPKFVDLNVSAQVVKAGEAVMFCFKAVNAAKVTGGPGQFAKGGLASGDCLVDHPRQTTTYRLTVSSLDGQSDTDQVTVQVKGN